VQGSPVFLNYFIFILSIRSICPGGILVKIYKNSDQVFPNV